MANDYMDGPDVMNVKPSYWKTVASMGVAGVVLHVVHLAEARYVLQNRLPNFQTYPSLFSLFRDSLSKTGGEFLNGMPGIIPIFGLIALTNYQFLGATSLSNIVIQGGILHSFAYPFLTAQRRMEAQSPNKAGMLHPRYGNYLSCLYHMWREEGPKGFYRGYFPQLLATGTVLTVVPFLADQMLQRSNLYGRGKGDQNE
jgi:hypothetical protein